MTRIRVRTLGGLGIEADGREILDLPSQALRCGLFVYLALERAATRDELTALFWPERDAERARHSLSQALYDLRRQLGDGWLVSHGDRLSVGPELSVDALEFARAVEAGSDEDALRIYRGPFLEGSHLGGTSGFESWSDSRRTHFGRLHRELCRRVASVRVREGDLDGALAVARHWVEADPLDDEAQHRLIEILAETGRRSDALRQYDEYEELLSRELEVEPLDETKALVARIRTGGATGALGELERAEASAEPDRLSPAAGPAGEFSHPLEAAAGQRAGAGVARRHLPGGWPVGGAVLACLVVGLVIWYTVQRSPTSITGHGESVASSGIAVLPFLNLSADPDQEYFSDGLTEDLLTSLSRIEGVRVISRTSVWRYKGSALPVGEIARELGVDYVLEGSVRRDGSEVRISAQLIDPASDAHVWAETYDRQLTGIFELQSEIAQQIATVLRQRLSPDDRARIATGGTDDVAAYDLLLRGREYLNRPGDADLRKYAPAMGFFRRALAVDPNFAPAYVGLAESFRRNVGLVADVAADSALAYAGVAVQLDPGLAEAATVLGAAFALKGDSRRAHEEFRRALALDPNQADALSGLARLAAVSSRLDEAIRWERRAIAVDPFSATRLFTLGTYLFDLGDLDGAELAFERSVEFAPDFPSPSFLLAQIHLLRGEEERADLLMHALMQVASDHPAARPMMGRYETQRGRYAAAQEHLEVMSPLGPVVAFRAHHARKTGEGARAAELLEGLRDRLRVLDETGREVPPRARLYVQALSGDTDGALATLAAHWRSGLRGASPGAPEIGVYWIDAEPFLEGLREDPRFHVLLQEIRMELDALRATLDG